MSRDKDVAINLRTLFEDKILLDITKDDNAPTIPLKIKEYKNRIKYIREAKEPIHALKLQPKQKKSLHASADSAIKTLRSKISELKEQYKKQISRKVSEIRKDPDGSKLRAKRDKNRKKKQRQREKEKKRKEMERTKIAMTQWAEQFNKKDFDPTNETPYPFELDDEGPITDEEIRRVSSGGRKTKRKNKRKNKKSKKRRAGMRKTKKRFRRKRKKRSRRHK